MRCPYCNSDKEVIKTDYETLQVYMCRECSGTFTVNESCCSYECGCSSEVSHTDKLYNWGSILWSAWVRGDKSTEIIGCFHEDGSMYKIVVPQRLRDTIIEIQNWLCNIYIEIEKLKTRIISLENIFKEVK